MAFVRFRRTRLLIFQYFRKSGELRGGETLAADCGFETELSEGGEHRPFVVAAARKAVDEGLAPHGERRAHEPFDVISGGSAALGYAHDGAVDVGRGIEHMPSDATCDAYVAGELRSDGKRAVVFAARRSRHALGDFLLYHYGDRAAALVIQEAEKHGRRYVIRKIGDSFIFAAEGQIALHEVREYDGKAEVRFFYGREIFAQTFVYFIGVNASAGVEQPDGERAHARSHLDDGIAFARARVRRYCGEKIAVGQEVLPERM